MLALNPNLKAIKPSLIWTLKTSIAPFKAAGTIGFIRPATATLEEPVDGLIKTVKAFSHGKLVASNVEILQL